MGRSGKNFFFKSTKKIKNHLKKIISQPIIIPTPKRILQSQNGREISRWRQSVHNICFHSRQHKDLKHLLSLIHIRNRMSHYLMLQPAWGASDGLGWHHEEGRRVYNESGTGSQARGLQTRPFPRPRGGLSSSTSWREESGPIFSLIHFRLRSAAAGCSKPVWPNGKALRGW